MLFIAAVIEAFWSGRHFLSPALRYAAGAAGWALHLLYFLFAGRERRSAPAREGTPLREGQQ
jgi:hypothetical protein